MKLKDDGIYVQCYELKYMKGLKKMNEKNERIEKEWNECFNVWSYVLNDQCPNELWH